MKGSMNTHLGNIFIDSEVIAQYAGSVAVECFGIVGMASVNVKDGLVKLLVKDSITHGIAVNIVNNKLPKKYVVFKTAYFFIFPVVIILASIFGLGTLFRSAEGYHSRLIATILFAVCLLAAIGMFVANKIFEENEHYKAFSYHKSNHHIALLLKHN